MNQLYYGDNLDVLRRHMKDESVDLVYLDPPFKSHQDYNVLFEEQDGTRAAAQIMAFEDTWHWDQGSAAAYADIVEQGPEAVSKVMQAFRTFLGENDMLAYLSMMAPRLVELRRVLKRTGSIYLHCDPTASHYLKLLMDAVFGFQNFRSEIVWKRSSAHSDTKQGRKIHGHIHDTLLFYSKSDDWTWNPVYTAYDEEYTESFYRHRDQDRRRFRLSDLTAARPGGDTEYEWRVKRLAANEEAKWEADLENEYPRPKRGWEYQGIRPYRGRYWAYSRANMEQFEQEGRLYYARTGMPSYKRYLDEMPGVPLQDLWTDIPPVGPGAGERLGYQTQKPEALLDRIIQTSSNGGDLVLDPFCGCGTTVASAEHLKRRWIGIDITQLAINLIRHRLRHTYGEGIEDTYEVIGEPVSRDDAAKLAAEDPYQFQFWALGLVGARPAEQKKGADRGIDGRLYFHDEPGGSTKQIVISVKSGKTGVSHVRDLRGVLAREKAAIGVLITFQEPTRAMVREAAAAGFFASPWGNHPRIQILTIRELLGGTRIDYPAVSGANITYKRAPRRVLKVAEQLRIDDE